MLDFARAGDEAFFSVLTGGDCGAEARKAWDLSSRNEVVDFRLQAGHFLVNSDKKVTKETPPRSLRPPIAKEEAR
jgi:hypothetical protein